MDRFGTGRVIGIEKAIKLTSDERQGRKMPRKKDRDLNMQGDKMKSLCSIVHCSGGLRR